MNAGRKILTNYRLSDYVTRLRYSAKGLRMESSVARFDAHELDEIADLLEALIQSPTKGSVLVLSADAAEERARGGSND